MFGVIMDEFCSQADEETLDLVVRYQGIMDKCRKLSNSFGEKKNITPEAFFSIFVTIVERWGKAHQALDKIEKIRLKAEKMASKKKKIKKKLSRRPTQEDMRNSGILKERDTAKQEQRKKKLTENIIDTFLKRRVRAAQAREKKFNLRSRHASVYLASFKYICNHCGLRINKMIEKSKISELVRTAERHLCYKSPGNKDEGVKVYCDVFYEKKNRDCKFSCRSACMTPCDDSGIPQYDFGGESLFGSNLAPRVVRSVSNSPTPFLRCTNSTDFATGNGNPFPDLLTVRKQLEQWRKDLNSKESPATLLSGRLSKKNGGTRAIMRRRKRKNKNSKMVDSLIYQDVMEDTPSLNKSPLKKKVNIMGKYKKLRNRNHKSAKNKPSPLFDIPNINPTMRSISSGEAQSIDVIPILTSISDEDIGTPTMQDNSSFRMVISPSHSPAFNPINKYNFGGISPPIIGSNLSATPIHDQFNNKGRVNARQSVFQSMHNGFNENESVMSDEERIAGGYNIDVQLRARTGSGGNNLRGRHRKRLSIMSENPQAETFILTEEQKEKLDNCNFCMDLKAEFHTNGYGSINYNIGKLRVVVRKAELRNKAVKFLEQYLGELTSTISTAAVVKELRFPLTSKQIDMLTNDNHFQTIMCDMSEFGKLNVDIDHLVLTIKNNQPEIVAIHTIEKRLGVLLRDEDVAKLMDQCGYEMNAINNIRKRAQFLNTMMKTLHHGARFRKHNKRGQPSYRWVLVHNDRLYWKENVQEQNRKNRSLHFSRIVRIMPGKCSKALQMATDVEESCCLSVISKKATLDLEAESEEITSMWISYLKGLQRHFIGQAEAAKQQRHQKRFSNIGLGF